MEEVDGDVLLTQHEEVEESAAAPPPQAEIDNTFAQDEAALEAYLEEKNPKPKKLSLRERILMRMPEISKATPKVGIGLDLNGKGDQFIDFSDEKVKKVDLKKQNGITALMERFAKHAAASAPSDKEGKPQHYKIHVNKLEKDSQGIMHSVTDEIDYVNTTQETEEEEDIMAQVRRSQGSSPREQVPGEKLYKLKNVLKERIRAKKVKEYEEKLKLHAIYSDEKELEDKAEDDELPEDEVEDDEEIDSEDSEEEDEEEEEDYVVGKQKKRKRLLYIEDEAEDEDEERPSGSEEEDMDESQSQLENEQSQIVAVPQPSTSESSDMDSSEINSQLESQKVPQDLNPIAQLIAATGKEVDPNDDNQLVDLCSGKFTSQEMCLPPESQNCFGFDVEDEEDDVPEEVPEVESQEQDQEKESSSQAPATPIQESESQQSISTPQNFSNSILHEDTPKVADRIVKRSSLGKRFEMEARLMEEERIKSPDIADKSFLESDDEEELFGTIKIAKTKKRKRLQFSDDEESDKEEVEQDDIVENEEEFEFENEEAEVVEDEEEDEEAEFERQLIRQAEEPVVVKKRPQGLFGRDGRLQKKFVEDEAELSGSEEGSGDEDERGLNFYEKEDADDEELDEEDVRKNLEKAHLKHLLDKDDREIRILQEEYLERGDLEDGKQRERKFRWTNVDETWADEAAMMGESDGEGVEDEEEIKRKIADIERRKWINENSQILEASEEESQKLLFENSKVLKLGKTNRKKIESFIEHSSTSISNFVINESSNSNLPNFSISALVKSKIKASSQAILAAGNEDEEDGVKLGKANSQPLFASPDEASNKFKRGSFLSRGSPSLNRLAEITKVNETVNNVKSNSRNFVFSHIPKEPAGKGPKRPAHYQVGQPNKMVKIDRSFNNMDESSKEASVFKWF